MGNKKIGLGLMLNLIGAMFAYLIGSGFASGQETMQYFSGWLILHILMQVVRADCKI